MLIRGTKTHTFSYDVKTCVVIYIYTTKTDCDPIGSMGDFPAHFVHVRNRSIKVKSQREIRRLMPVLLFMSSLNVSLLSRELCNHI